MDITVVNDKIVVTINNVPNTTSYSPQAIGTLTGLQKKYNNLFSDYKTKEITREVYDTKLADLLADIELVIKGGNLDKTDKYFVIGESLVRDEMTKQIHFFFKVQKEIIVSALPMPQPLVDMILLSEQKGNNAQPLYKFWVNLLRNPIIRAWLDADKVENALSFANRIVKFITDIYVYPSLYNQYVEQGFTHELARELATVKQNPITQGGLVSVFKVVNQVDNRYEWILDENKQAVRLLKDGISVGVDKFTGEISVGDFEFAEDMVFYPAIMGTSGHIFTCEGNYDVYKGHGIVIGKEAALPADYVKKGLRMAAAGFHGGNPTQYVNGYSNNKNFTLNIFVNPMYIHDIAPNEGAIVFEKYYPYSIYNRVVSYKEPYHPSAYADVTEAQWNVIRTETINSYKERLSEIEKKINYTAML